MSLVSFRHNKWLFSRLGEAVKGREALPWACPHGEGICWMLWSGLVWAVCNICLWSTRPRDFSCHSTSGQPYVMLTFQWIKPSEGGKKRFWEQETSCHFCCDISHTSHLSSKCSGSLNLCGFCAIWKPHSFKKQAMLRHHAFTENSNGCWSNSSLLNKSLLWGSGVPAFQILQHCSGNIVQLHGLVCWYGTFHYSCFFYSEENPDSPSEIPCAPGLSSFGARCWPSQHTHGPARRCAECTSKQLASVWMLAWNLSFLPDVHTEAVQAALAKHKERKMAVPMPSKRRSLVVQTSMDAYTPPGEHLSVFYENFKNGSLCCYELVMCLHR